MIPCFEDMGNWASAHSFCGFRYGNDWSSSLTLGQLIGYDLLGTAILIGGILGTIFFFVRRENKKANKITERSSEQ